MIYPVHMGFFRYVTVYSLFEFDEGDDDDNNNNKTG